ncbi:hypothetical protein SEA_BING_55 [Streptomyces phage Bing]|uniref:Uncharacterized protein n=1 Tax=Streptomyces phage Bing TaxID=2079427 RepID=A0A2L1IWB0_9CAUD|nr:hypothetical protein FDJ31_gp55 [Streptomyces phage Bing]AVD99477.1 hypothetical protein SEA_BING_55 [Streptomyces phage Bing]
MDEYTYQEQETETGTHILIFREEAGGHVFQRKIFVPVSEYHPDALACVVDGAFHELYTGSHKNVVKWLNENPGKAKMVGTGGDFQILSVSEYIFHRG